MTYVYFLSCPQLKRIKIGISKNPKRRWQGIASHFPGIAVEFMGCVAGDRKKEAAFQAKFNRLRIGGEWFKSAPRLFRFIEKLPLLNENLALKPADEGGTPDPKINKEEPGYSVAGVGRMLCLSRRQVLNLLSDPACLLSYNAGNELISSKTYNAFVDSCRIPEAALSTAKKPKAIKIAPAEIVS